MRTHVLMCCHNGAKYVEEQVQSIVMQSRPVDDIHIFDFSSTDGTREIVRRLAMSISVPTISLTEEPDAPGASLSFFRAFARLAIDVDDRDVVFFCDQDDLWRPNKVEVIVATLDSLMNSSACENSAVFHDVEVVNERLDCLRSTYYVGDPFSIPRDLAPDRLLLANPVIGHTLAVSGALLKTVSRHLAHSSYMMHDWATVLVASRIGRVEFVPMSLSLYRQHETNVLGAYGRRSARDVFRRTLVFSLGMVGQALTFAADLQQIAGQSSTASATRRLPQIDRFLAFIRPATPWLAFPMLAAYAAVRGPTLRRRLFSAVILLAGVWQAFGLPIPTLRKRVKQ